MPMRPYVVCQGDHLTCLAFLYGFDAATVWNDGANSDLAARRSNPDILAPGDVLQIPVPVRNLVTINPGSTNQYKAALPKTTIHCVFRNGPDPLANEAYTIMGDGDPAAGQTDGDGKLTVAVHVLSTEVRIHFTRLDRTFRARIGHLDPVETRSGVTQRLTHLGYLPPGSQPDENSDHFTQVIRAFQAVAGVTIIGTIDEATRAALTSAHGS